jgi:5'-AMP-activated protein kinase, catalytic alpha subunit
LEKNKIATHSDAERVNREIRILKIARHPNILQLYEIIETVKYLHLVTEYIEKGELFDYIVSNGHIKERESCIFFHGLISGIEYLHDMKIAHR